MTTTQSNVNVNAVKANAVANEAVKNQQQQPQSGSTNKTVPKVVNNAQKKTTNIKAASIKARRTKAQAEKDNLVKAVDANLSTGRNFYAVKENAKGQEIHYAFETVQERNNWLNRNEGAQIASALSVYRKLNRNSDEIIATNRNRRVIKVPFDSMIDLSKGQRVLIK